MINIRALPEQEPRVETGAVQFGEDWPGVFIRGDNALWFGAALGSTIQLLRAGKKLDLWDVMVLESLKHALDSIRP